MPTPTTQYEHMTIAEAMEKYGGEGTSLEGLTDMPCLVSHDSTDGALAIVPYSPDMAIDVENFEQIVRKMADDAIAKLRVERPGGSDDYPDSA